MTITISRVFFCFCLSLVASLPTAMDSTFFANAVAASYYLGRILPHDPQAAFRWYSKAARQGDSEATYILGTAFYEGKDVKADPTAAFFWWHQAAQVENVDAENAVGDAYCMGIGVHPDGREARRWWQQAESHGSRHAAEMLRGRGCTGHSSVVRERAMPEI